MRRFRLLLVVALGLAPGVGCNLAMPKRSPGVLPGGPVALVVDGSAFTRPEVGQRVEEAVQDASGRRVLVVDELFYGRNDPRRRLATRLAKDHPQVASYDWREPQCAAEAQVLVALATNTDAVYHVSLDAASSRRPATEADLRSPAVQPRGVRKVIAAMQPNEPRKVREESLDGGVGLAIFGREPSPDRVRVQRRASRLEPGAPPHLLDPAAITTTALGKLPTPRSPEWEAYARRLIGAGCPLLALSVADARLGTGATFRTVRTAALEAMRRNGDRRTARNGTSGRAAAKDLSVDGMSEPAPAAAQSCNDLCAMHMVELCNNDRALWIEHRVRWEPTPCGSRRPDGFLEECYRQQWQSGTYDQACVTPCESAPEGRDRLQTILRRAGCLN